MDEKSGIKKVTPEDREEMEVLLDKVIDALSEEDYSTEVVGQVLLILLCDVGKHFWNLPKREFIAAVVDQIDRTWETLHRNGGKAQ